MRLLMWDKPKKAMSSEEWMSWSADGAPPGVYQPNMSQEDEKKWRAKLTGQTKGRPQVEIRTSKYGQLVLIVSLCGKIKYKHEDPDATRTNYYGNTVPAAPPYCNVRLSANSPLRFTWETWAELQQAVEEAKQKLRELEWSNE